jgi:hypothetical protein
VCNNTMGSEEYEAKGCIFCGANSEEERRWLEWSKTKMAACKYWHDQPDGAHGYCQHPEARPGETCSLNTAVTCVLREFVEVVPRDNEKNITPKAALGGTTIIAPEADYEAMQARIKTKANVRYAFVDCLNCRVSLACMVFSEDGHGSHMERFTAAEMAWLGVTEEMLYDAIEEVGGSITLSGHYHITAEIRAKLEAAIER